MIDSLLDFSERCRLCIEPKRLSLDIFSDEGKKMKLKSKINKNLPLKVSQSDGLPSQVCYQCLFRLETWISFKQLCVERDQLMKTWSQSVLDEAASEVDATYNGGKSNCPKGTVRMSGSSRSLKKHSATRDEEAISGTFISAHHIDDAKSDSSLWEVVKMDDSGSQGEASPDRESSQVITNSTDSDYCTHPEGTSGRSIDGSKRKSWNQNTVPSSGSDTSAVIDIGQSSVRVASESLHCPILASALSSMDKNQAHFQERLSLDHSLQPMKRKRGRPSKASLQRERDMKKIRDLDNIDADHILFSSEGSMADANFKNENEKETPTCDGSSEDVISYQVAHPPVVIPEFMPVTRDGGSGVTEVVLDDPDVGSMKFTLSIVDVESPESSPTLHDNFKYYNYASSSGHASSDPLLREDFEGFESPTSSNIPGNLLKDRTGSLDEIVDNISVSKIVVDVRLGCSNDINPAPMDQKQRSSVSPNCGANGSISGDLNVDHEELENEDSKLQTYIQKTLSVSKSLECLLVSDNYLKPPQEALDERNAYSDGELSESPKKRQRRKSLVS